MRPLRVLLLLALLSIPVSAAPVPPKPTPSPTPRKYRLGDTEPRMTFIQRIENAIPVAILVFFGFRGNVRIQGEAHN